MRSTMPLASSPLCSATSRSTLSRSRSWMCRSTACFAVWAAMRLKSSDGSISIISLPSSRTTRLRTSSAPVFVSSFTLTWPAGLKARAYATASAASTVCSISSKGMPTSAQSAVSASARLSVEGSDCDREPARDNVIPRNVNDYRSSATGAQRGDRDARRIDCNQLAFDHCFRGSAAIADIPPLAVETLVIGVHLERPLGAWRRDLEVVGSFDEARVVEQRAHDAADALAVLDFDWFAAVDRDPQRAPRLARLFQGVQLVAHVVERGLEQLSDRRYWPCRHVRVTDITLAGELTERLEPPPDHQERRGVEDRAVRARHDADEHRQRESLQRPAARA